MKQTLVKQWRRQRRTRHVRRTIWGTPEQPRMAVNRSNRNIGVQLIDDTVGRTLCAVEARAKDVRAQIGYGGNAKAAAVIGQLVAEKARQLGIERVCFDRRGWRYHGRLKALAEAARKAGLKF